MEATIRLEYADGKLAKAVANAVSPDNFKTPPKLTVKTTLDQRKVITVIQCESKLATFTATIDDLLSCATTLKKRLKLSKRFRHRQLPPSRAYNLRFFGSSSKYNLPYCKVNK